MPPLCQDWQDQQIQTVERATVQCVNTGQILKKMKGLKMLKKKMGIAATAGKVSHALIPSTPICFHNVHGENVGIYNEGRVIRRTQSFCHAIAFSSRPVKVNERVYLRLLEVANNWSGVLRFGFTAADPESLRGNLPKYVCPDLTSRVGFWAKALNEKHASQGSILSFYYNSLGELIYEIDSVEHGVLIKGLDISALMWVVVDVYGNTTSLQLIDPSTLMNNAPESSARAAAYVRRSPHAISNRNVPCQPCEPYRSSNKAEERVTIPGFGDMSISDPALMQVLDHVSINNSLPVKVHGNVLFNPMSFHSTKGSSIEFHDHNRILARRQLNRFTQGYIFTGRPLVINEKMVVQVLAVDNKFVGGLSFGVTSANPLNLHPSELPDDCDDLLDRPEYWVVCKNIVTTPRPGDELSFTFTSNGQITFAKNNESPHVIMHVDTSLSLFAFFDMMGSTTKVKMLGTTSVRDGNRSLQQQHRELQQQIAALTSLPPLQPDARSANPAPPQPAESLRPPPPRKPRQPHNPHANLTTATHQNQPTPSASACSTMPPQQHKPQPGQQHKPQPGQQHTAQLVSLSPGQEEGHECTVCYERRIDSVLYSCGHMCMCFACANVHWRAGGACPICRAPIRDVIRTYKA